MHHFRSNPPSRGIKPRPTLTPAARLLRAVENHLDEHNLSPSAFGRQVNGGTRLVPQLRAGTLPAPSTVDRLVAILSGGAAHA